jgi:hypothetical protein
LRDVCVHCELLLGGGVTYWLTCTSMIKDSSAERHGTTDGTATGHGPAPARPRPPARRPRPPLGLRRAPQATGTAEPSARAPSVLQ